MQSDSLLSRLYNILKQKKVIIVYLPLALYWLAIFIATTVPTDPVPQFFNAQDKLEHFSAYFVLSVFLLLTLHFQRKINLLNRKAILFTFILLALYGAVDEIHQYFIPGRFCDITDWASDITGGLMGIGLIGYLLKKVNVLDTES